MQGYYHLSVDVIGRSKGRSAVACAAYRAGDRLEDRRYGKIHDYSPRKGILASGLVLPDQSPEWAQEREKLWNELEAFEKRKDAQLAREFVLALPYQLTTAQNEQLVQVFIRAELTPHGLVADWSIHAPNREGDERNNHAHIMATMRRVNDQGFETIKDRSQNTPEQLQKWREAWADIQNRAFEKYDVRDSEGKIVQVDHRSYEAQGLDLEPTQHMGVHATAMERRGIQTEIGERNREIKRSNGGQEMPPGKQPKDSYQEALDEALRRADDERKRQDLDHGFDL